MKASTKTLALVLAAVIVASVFSLGGCNVVATPTTGGVTTGTPTHGPGSTTTDPTTVPPTSGTATSSPTAPATDTATTEPTVTKEAKPVTFDNTLFIGDSRTEGIRIFSYVAKETNAHFYSSTGVSVFQISFAKPEGGVLKEKFDSGVYSTLDDVLATEKYEYIFLMLGINEVGGDLANNAKAYGTFVEKLRQAQPDAVIVLQGNLHVTKWRSDENRWGVNNAAIDALNAAQAEHADEENNIYYIDPNTLFDGPDGGLDTTIADAEGAHFSDYNQYNIWCNWMKVEVETLVYGGAVPTPDTEE